jgi:hypothetical protein
MSDNDQTASKLSLKQRLDPGRVAALEQQHALHSQLIVNRALSDVSNLLNALEFLTQQANAGHPGARQVLSMLFANLDAARAASAGIALPSHTPPPGG